MSFQKDIYEKIDDAFYEKLGGIIYYIEDIRDQNHQIMENLNPSKSVERYSYSVVANEAFVATLYFDNESNVKVFVDAIYLDDGHVLPKVFYNIEEDEQTLIKNKQGYPEAIESGHYRTWRFVSERW